MKLQDLECFFQGVIPSKIATCSKDGWPNAAYLSHVFMIDNKHVASSYQFFNKTKKNLNENPFASIMVRHPVTLHPYVLKVRYLRSEESGPTFEKMSVKLDVIASYEGMRNVFRLLAADIYEVIEIQDRGALFKESSQFEDIKNDTNLEGLELARVMSENMNRLTTLEDLLDDSLKDLKRYFGWNHAFVLLYDDPKKQLVTYASFGYEKGGVGSEVKLGEGLIGLCAARKKLFQISAIRQATSYTKAMARTISDEQKGFSIPLPGLKDPSAQIAAPILFKGELVGVLAVESAEKNWWDTQDQLRLALAANQLASAISAHKLVGISSISEKQHATQAVAQQPDVWSFRYVEEDDVMFVNDQYLIKNVPAQILKYLLHQYLEKQRTDFSNMELRTAKELDLPEIKDNLETRLILLRKRLQEHEAGLQIRSAGRGRFKIEVSGKITFARSGGK